MNRRIGAFVALAVILAALFVGFGFWQLRRLQERRVYVAALRARLGEQVLPFEQLPDTSSFRRAIVTGTPDHDNEIVFTGRSRNGSPGVYVLTPVRRAGSDTAVVVIRGWVYAPDAATVDLARWSEARTNFTGYVAAFPRSAPPPAGAWGATRRVRALSAEGVRRMMPYPVAGMYLVSQDSAPSTAPARLGPPALDNGPHLSYAIQWFSFATIALAGAAVVVTRAMKPRGVGATGA